MTGEPNALLSARWVSRAGSPREERDRGRQGERAQRRARMAEGPSLAALARPGCPASRGRIAWPPTGLQGNDRASAYGTVTPIAQRRLAQESTSATRSDSPRPPVAVALGATSPHWSPPPDGRCTPQLLTAAARQLAPRLNKEGEHTPPLAWHIGMGLYDRLA